MFMFVDELITNGQREQADYCRLALDSLLADDWESAQAALLIPLLTCDSEQDERLMHNELIESLHSAIEQQNGNRENSAKILNFIQSIFPDDLNSLLRLIEFELQTQTFSFTSVTERQLVDLLASVEPTEINQELLHRVIAGLLRIFDRFQAQLLPELFIPELVKIFIQKSQNLYQAVSMLASEAFLLGEQRQLNNMRAILLGICLEHSSPDAPWYFDIMIQNAFALAITGQYDAAIKLAEKCCQVSSSRSQEDIVIASQQMLMALMESGRWQLIPDVAQQHQANLDTLVTVAKEIRNWSPIIAASYFLNYVEDAPRKLHGTRNAIGRLCALSIQKKFGIQIADHQVDTSKKVLRIGYICSTLRKHSVGWLSRWLFAYHNHQDFEIFIYNVSHDGEDEFYNQYFKAHADVSYSFGVNVPEIVQQIQQDKIDILVDMDSLALSTTFEVMCCRPAPIQVTWLGWDASGCPEIDYFIADSYVVPTDAEDYYHSKIWRLPQTYLAIDGFEMGLPTRRREDYGIPHDAIIYLCGQKSYKHNPDILRLQIQIIKEVPNSYLLVKLLGDRDSLINTYQEIASQAEISMDRLRFLERDPDELTHRANLAIADVVLDTFPYNGATTTLETLWAGVPMVTKVGQAFVARNSYAFMTNVGVTEGIAYSDEEYVEWGIRLGTDVGLRQLVSGKLIHSRKTSPLWNTAQFALEMENAYRQMWHHYSDRQGI
jgi:predicted O-linked N-acetylglucosamine transferase (SPINDLY family)